MHPIAPAASLARSLLALLLTLGATASVAGDYVVPVFVRAIVDNAERTADDRKLDARRHPLEMLAFFGVRPGMSVVDIGAGRGYTAELLARAVGPTGKVLAQTDPIIVEKFIKTTPARYALPVMANTTYVVRPTDDPLPEGSGPFDLVTVIFVYHDLVWMQRDRAAFDRRMFNAIKPGGYLVVADHHANPGSGIAHTQDLHRIEEGNLRQEIEAAGFRLVDSGHFLENPLDPRDAPYFKATVPVDQFIHKYLRP